jgi:hypothetical protein
MIEHNFEWQFYLNHYPDLRKAGINNQKDAYRHWCNHGKTEKRVCCEEDYLRNKSKDDNKSKGHNQNSEDREDNHDNNASIPKEESELIEELVHKYLTEKVDNDERNILDKINDKHTKDRKEIDEKYQLKLNLLEKKYKEDRNILHESYKNEISDITQIHLSDIRTIKKLSEQNKKNETVDEIKDDEVNSINIVKSVDKKLNNLRDLDTL